MKRFPFCVRTRERTIYIDRPAFEHLVHRHMLADRPAIRQFKRNFELAFGRSSVSAAMRFLKTSDESDLIPAARLLAELLVDDMGFWIKYRRQSDQGTLIDRRLNLYLGCGMIVVFQIEDDEWFLRTAFFAAQRNRALENRRDAIANQIRNQFGKPVDFDGKTVFEFDSSHQCRSQISDKKYAVQTDFELSDPIRFGIFEMDERRFFDFSKIQRN